MKVNQATSKVITQKTHANQVTSQPKVQNTQTTETSLQSQVTSARLQTDFLDSIGALKSALNEEIVSSMTKHQLPLTKENFQMIHQTLTELYTLNENMGQLTNAEVSETLNTLVQDLTKAMDLQSTDLNFLPNLLSDTKQLTSVLSFLTKHDLPITLDNLKFSLDLLSNKLNIHTELTQVTQILEQLDLPDVSQELTQLIKQIDQSIIKPESHFNEIFKEITSKIEEVIQNLPRTEENKEALQKLETQLNNFKNIETVNQSLLYFNTPIHLNDQPNQLELLSDEHNNHKGTSKNQKFQFTFKTHNMGDVQCQIHPRNEQLVIRIRVQDEQIEDYVKNHVLALHKNLKHLPFESIAIVVNHDEFSTVDEFLDHIDLLNKYKLNIKI